MKEFLIIIEKARIDYSAYSPDVPGCVATGRTPAEAKQRMQQALELHLAGLKEDGLPVPTPHARAEYAAVA